MNRRQFFALIGAVFTAPFLPRIVHRPKPVIHTSGYVQAGDLACSSYLDLRQITDHGHQHTLYPAGQNMGINPYQNFSIGYQNTLCQNKPAREYIGINRQWLDQSI